MFNRPSALAAILFLSAGASAQEMAKNPDYANWSKFAKGTSVTTDSTSVFPDGRTSTMTETLTLTEIAADKVVLTVEFISAMPGQAKIKYKPKSREIPKTVPVPAGSTVEEIEAKLPGTTEVGKDAETVKSEGGEFQAKWFKTSVENGKNITVGKTWISDAVPGRVVKSERTTSTNGTVLYTTTVVVNEVWKP